MLTLLVPVDGSAFSDRALQYAIARAQRSAGGALVHLLNVQTPAAGVNVKMFVSSESLNAYYRDEGMKILEPLVARLRAAGIPAEHHIGVGNVGEVVVAYAVDKGCDEIVMGTHGRGGLLGSVLGSVAQNVVQLARVPVVLVK
ncbi:MAG: universal stress protein [Steroidobacteraceae bacterium]|jgi:nucleotide-binding universal stress UspA family protein|nr:universal stress protein [Steroidobacteraceae bacterium]